MIRSARRDALREHLADREIETAIYYPLALHEQPCFEYLGYKAGDFPEAERAAREKSGVADLSGNLARSAAVRGKLRSPSFSARASSYLQRRRELYQRREGRYRSGQTGQTVNLLALRLRWFESSPAQIPRMLMRRSRLAPRHHEASFAGPTKAAREPCCESLVAPSLATFGADRLRRILHHRNRHRRRRHRVVEARADAPRSLSAAGLRRFAH